MAAAAAAVAAAAAEAASPAAELGGGVPGGVVSIPLSSIIFPLNYDILGAREAVCVAAEKRGTGRSGSEDYGPEETRSLSASLLI